MLAMVLAMLAGCAAPPGKVLAPRTSTGTSSKVVLSQRAFDEIATARARELALHALSHIGVPYRYGGTSPEGGFDCSGLVQYVYSRGAGLVLPRNTQALSAVGAPVDVGDLEPGDLVFFDTLRKPYSHVGIYLGDQRFIHAPTTGGQVELVDIRDRYWQSRYNGARRLEL
jgi:cell wall-associated NlpC family hydrolase